MSRTVSPAVGLYVLLAAYGAVATEPAARSGDCEGLTLAVSGSAVASVFAEQRGMGDPGGPQFNCFFLLNGTLAGDRATVETWSPSEPERIAGRLDFTRDGAALTLSENHGGCLMTTGTMVGTPYALSRNSGEASTEWVGVGLVTARRTAFRHTPGPAPARAPYLFRSDPVAVLERRDGWLRGALSWWEGSGHRLAAGGRPCRGHALNGTSSSTEISSRLIQGCRAPDRAFGRA